jgi:excisionase family DNA binding protein
MNENEIMTIRDVSLCLKLSERTIRDMIARGELPAAKLAKSWRIRKADVEKLLTPTTRNEDGSE